MMKDMTKGKIPSELIRFSIPLILGNLFQLTYNCLLYTSDAADEL